MARKKTSAVDPDARETREELARTVRQLAKYVNIMLNAYRSPLMGGPRPDGWTRFDDENYACPDWERVPAAYSLAGNLLFSVSRLSATLGLAAEVGHLADLAGVLSLHPVRLEDLPIRRLESDDEDDVPVALLDDRLEPVRGMVLALAKARFALDLLSDQVEAEPRDLRAMAAERTKFALRLREEDESRTWDSIVWTCDEAFPESLGLPKLTSIALRSAWARRPDKRSKNKRNNAAK